MIENGWYITNLPGYNGYYITEIRQDFKCIEDEEPYFLGYSYRLLIPDFDSWGGWIRLSPGFDRRGFKNLTKIELDHKTGILTQTPV